MDAAGADRTSHRLSGAASPVLSVTVMKAAASAGWSGGRTTQALSMIVRVWNVTGTPRRKVSAVVRALTLSSAWIVAPWRGCHTSGNPAGLAGGGTGAGASGVA